MIDGLGEGRGAGLDAEEIDVHRENRAWRAGLTWLLRLLDRE